MATWGGTINAWPFTEVTTAATTTLNTWIVWNQTGTATTTIDQWQYWNSTTGVGWTTGSGYSRLNYKPRELTPEELEAQRVAAAQREEQAAKIRADREQAVQRAETLLHAHLSPAQRKQLAHNGRFKMRSQEGRLYEIRRGHHGNIVRLDDGGKEIEKLCVYATGGVPEADCMLAQKLYLEMNEAQLRRVAHITPVAA